MRPVRFNKNTHKKTTGYTVVLVAPQVGLEPTTLRLTAECSAIELLRNMDVGEIALSNIIWNPAATYSPGPFAAKYHRRVEA